MEEALQLTKNDYTAVVETDRIELATATCWLIQSTVRYDEIRAVADIPSLQRLLVLRLDDSKGHYISFLKTKKSSRKSQILKKLLFTSTPGNMVFIPYLNRDTVIKKILKYADEHENSLVFDWTAPSESSEPSSKSPDIQLNHDKRNTMIQMIENGFSLLDLVKYDFDIYEKHMIIFKDLKAEVARKMKRKKLKQI